MIDMNGIFDGERLSACRGVEGKNSLGMAVGDMPVESFFVLLF